jgi:ABC-2 type transport system ATP-binding protein
VRSGGDPEHDDAADRPARRAAAQLFRRSLEVRIRAPLADPEAVFGDLPEAEGWERLPAGSYQLAASDPEIAAPAVARALVGAGADIVSIGESRHSLEDVYLELITEDVEARRR